MIPNVRGGDSSSEPPSSTIFDWAGGVETYWEAGKERKVPRLRCPDSRFGDPIDIHPNNADTIAGRSNKVINLVDGTGRLLTFQGVTNPDGTTSWFEPPGVHLFLRSVTTDTTNPRFWAITRPDRVTFWYNSAGFPTFVTDKNGNALSFTLSAVQPGDDPGGPRFHVTQVTDAAGQGRSPTPNRSFNVTYFTKQTAKKPQIRGKVASITDHLGHQLSFSYCAFRRKRTTIPAESGQLIRTNPDSCWHCDARTIFSCQSEWEPEATTSFAKHISSSGLG